MSAVIPVSLLFATMLACRIYPKQTMIVMASATLIVLLYPLIKMIRIANICTCGW